jgi:hypothetical protein
MNAHRLLYLGFAVVAGTNDAHAAGLMLTPAGVAGGFSISVFASGISNNGSYGPMGSVATSSGNVLVTDFGGSPQSTFSWTDVDGQTPGSALADSSVGTSYFGITNAQGKIYAVNFSGGTIDLLNNDGSFNSVFLALPGGTNFDGNGITTNPVNGHIYVDSGNGINDIDPVTKAVRNLNNAIGDGITVSPDGNTVYLAEDDSVVAFDTTTGAATGFSASVPGADGVGIIQSGSIFNGYLVVNSNDGIVDLVNPTTGVVTMIASSGSRGDFVGLDYNNGTLFLSQTDSVDRLSCGVGCSFTSMPSVSYLTKYAANLNIGESYIAITNTGANGAPLLGPGFGGATGNICVNVYAFDPGEELIACCSCLITPDRIVNLGVNRDLTVKTRTGVAPTSVTVKLLTTLAGGNGTGASCTNSAATVTTATLAAGAAAWGTTLHSPPTGGSYATTEAAFAPSTLSPGELASIGGRCASIVGNGSGFGVCNSCRAGALGGTSLPQ